MYLWLFTDQYQTDHSRTWMGIMVKTTSQQSVAFAPRYLQITPTAVFWNIWRDARLHWIKDFQTLNWYETNLLTILPGLLALFQWPFGSRYCQFSYQQLEKSALRSTLDFSISVHINMIHSSSHDGDVQSYLLQLNSWHHGNRSTASRNCLVGTTSKFPCTVSCSQLTIPRKTNTAKGCFNKNLSSITINFLNNLYLYIFRYVGAVSFKWRTPESISYVSFTITWLQDTPGIFLFHNIE